LNSLISGNAFESGDLDSVSVTGKDVGTINNIRLRIDGEDTWNLEYVMVNDLFFNYRRNLADRNTITLTSSKYTDYEVKIKTGTYFKSGTDSEAYIKITGNSGSTGWIWINDLIDHNAFEYGNTDTFTIKKAIDVGTITEISLQIERGFIDYDSWYVEYAVVNNIPFEVQQWIEEDYVIATPCEAITNYTVKLRTGTVPYSGTDSNVYLSINGTKGSTASVYLNGLLSGNVFENGDLDTVTICGVKDVGTIESITVYLDGGDDWYLDGMNIGEDYYPVHQWLSNSGFTAAKSNVTDYTITITTADVLFAGTNGDVYVTLVGTNGRTDKILLDINGYDDFERNDTDTYTLNMVRNVGTVTQIILSLEDGNDWCVGSIKFDGETYTVNRWLEEDNELTIDLSSKSTVGGTAVGSIMTSGSVWIIVGIAVALAAAAIITVIVVKKRKKISG
ncbi:MAG: PLAT/LH2 domain-containing protein, partial [Eubacteriales bacterium]